MDALFRALGKLGSHIGTDIYNAYQKNLDEKERLRINNLTPEAKKKHYDEIERKRKADEEIMRNRRERTQAISYIMYFFLFLLVMYIFSKL